MRDEKQKQDADSVDVQLRYAALDGSPHQKNIVLQVREGVFAELHGSGDTRQKGTMKSTEAQVGWCTLHPVVRQFVCILNNCESVVIWAFNRSSAEVECREKYGEPVHTWATKRQFCTTPSALEKARLFGDIQTSIAASNYKPNPTGQRTAHMTEEIK